MLPRLLGKPSPCQEGVDRLGWKAGSVHDCPGARIGLRASDKSGLARLTAWLPRAVRPSRARTVPVLYSYLADGPGPTKGSKRFHILYRNFTRLARSLDLEDVERAFKRDISSVVGEHASRRVFVHAGVVAVDGGAVVIPGKSFSGKTTLTRALVEQGGVYYSDEFAVIDSKGRVSPWTEPLSIRMDGPKAPGLPHSPEALGFRSGRRVLPVRLVVMTSFANGRRFRPRDETRSRGALGLLEHTVPARRRPRAVLRALSEAVAGARVIRGRRGEAEQAAREILRYLATSRAA